MHHVLVNSSSFGNMECRQIIFLMNVDKLCVRTSTRIKLKSITHVSSISKTWDLSARPQQYKYLIQKIQYHKSNDC